MIKHNDTEKRLEAGQAIVIMAFVMIVLLGMLGLAIDGGRLFFLWRDTQNATDAAVLSAAYVQCLGGTPESVESAGRDAAANNGFDGVLDNTVDVNVDSDDLITVTIEAEIPSYFIRFVNPNPLQVVNDATGFCIPAFDPTQIPAAYAAGDCTGGGNAGSWTASRSYLKGGIYSGGDVQLGGGGAGPGIVIEDGDVEAGRTVEYREDKVTFVPPAKAVGNQDPPDTQLELNLEDWGPGGEIYEQIRANGGIVNVVKEGDAPADWKKTGQTWTPDGSVLLKGLYYVIGNASIGTGAKFDPDVGATIVATGTISFNSGSGGEYGYYGYKFAPGERWGRGILLYSTQVDAPNCGSNTITFQGSDTTAWGVLYAPKGGVKLNGSHVTIWGSIVSNNFDVSGSDIELIYEPDILPPKPPRTGFAG